MIAPLTLLAWLAQGAGLGISAAATPGPLQAFLLSNALQGHWRRSVPIAFAPLLADIPLVPLILLLLNQLPENFLDVIRILGGILLFYLAWGTWQQLRSAPSQDVEIESTGKGFRWAVLMAWLSPGPYLFWSLVTGPLLLNAWQQSGISAIMFLLSFYALFVGGNLALILIFYQTQRLGPKIVRLLQLLSALILSGFAVSLLFTGFSNLL